MTNSVIADIARVPRRGLLAALAVATLLGVGGCSSVPDAMNPVEWYRDTRDWIAGDDRVQPAKQAEAQPVPGADQPFPSLNSVPDRPAATPEADRRQLARTLEADREAARYTDEEIRRQTVDDTASSSAAPPSAPEVPDSPSAAPDASTAEAPPVLDSGRPPVPHQPAPPDVQAAETFAGQSAAVAAEPPPPMPAAPPPPAIPPAVTAGQPIPVDPGPAQPAYSAPVAPPAGLEAAPGGQRTAFVRPDRFSSRFPAGAGTVQGPRTLNPPPTAIAPEFAQPEYAQGTASAFNRAPIERFANAGTPVATVYFGVGSAKVDSRGQSAIREAFRTYQSRGGRVRVVGHASSRTRNMDRVSHELANFRVSDERARAVARELIRLGVDPGAIVVEAVSDQQPAFLEVMPAGEAGNRRAEILLEN